MRYRLLALSVGVLVSQAAALTGQEPSRAAPLRPVVEAEEDVYAYTPADNGAGPLWCRGSTCLVRVGDRVFASGLETLSGVPPLNNCRWTLFRRGEDGWKLEQADPAGRTREPNPLAAFPDGRVFLSANPTLAAPEVKSGPARPEVLQFSAADPKAAPERLLPGWDGKPRFTEHSYRNFVADGPNREMLLLQNVGYTHAAWAFLDRTGKWSARGNLVWPRGTEYDEPQPVRLCYATVALRDRAAHFCGVSDIVEPYKAWREYKRQLTGREWDYDFRRLFYTWSPDVTTGGFKGWVEIASRDKTAGWITPGDLWAAPDGSAHLLWTERAIDERLRGKFFPGAKQSYELNYAVVRQGQVVRRQTLTRDDGNGEMASAGRFQVTPEGRLFAVYYVHGKDAKGTRVSENRVLEIFPDGSAGRPVRLPLKSPFTNYFTASIRAGSPPSQTLELLGQRAGQRRTISYARVRLW